MSRRALITGITGQDVCILFNHESPRRGAEFVTRKISLAVAQIKLGASTATCCWPAPGRPVATTMPVSPLHQGHGHLSYEVRAVP
ncbi:GDP-mannose 4,6-dehydratase [Micromonosporaceae bacterium Da 78-11]